MPLPWKKTKNPNRISRIVADLQPPPSLVVETGFPAAVFDLFLKNRRRIKRSRTSLHNNHFPLLSPPPSPSLTTHHFAAAAVESTPPDVEFDVTANSHKNSNSKLPAGLLLAKMFLAVVPVMSSINLALRITLSAFLLFLLQILGQFVARFFNLKIRNRLLIPKTTELEFLSINSASTNEIQIVQSNSNYEQLGLHLENGIGCGSDLEVENEEEGKNERSRSWKLREKMMKKLIPKKMWSGKRLKRNKNKMKEEQEQEEQEVCEVEQIREVELEEEDEEEDDERKMNLNLNLNLNLECKIVIVMILLGLCGGRFLAFVLTLSGCFIFKFTSEFLYQKWKFG